MNLRPQDASKYLAERGIKLSVPTLNTYRHCRRGPAFLRVSGRIFYPTEELDAYVRRVTSPLMAQNHVPASATSAQAQAVSA